MTYFPLKAEGNVTRAKDLEMNAEGWLAAECYFLKSVLRVLANKICGDDIPTKMLEITTRLHFPIARSCL